MRIYFKQPVNGRIVTEYLARFMFRDPINNRVRVRTPSLGKGRQGVNDVADGSELDEKDPHVKTMLPKLPAMSEPLFCSVLEHI